MDYDGTRYLVLFGGENYESIYNTIRCVIRVKSDIIYDISLNYEKVKDDSCDYFPLEKTLTIHNVIILIPSIFNKDKNNYYYNIFLEKCSYQLPRDNDNKYFYHDNDKVFV